MPALGTPPATSGPHPVRYVPRPHTAPRRPHAPRSPEGLGHWIRLHKLATTGVVATVLLAVSAAAVLTMQINTTVNPSAKAPPVVFANGGDYTSINGAGFATLTLGTSTTSATLAMSGVAGAASVQLGNVMKISNTDATRAYTVTLSRSAAPNAAFTTFSVVVKNGATTLATWDVVASATSSSFVIPASVATDVSITTAITDGTATGALGTFTMQVSITP